MRPVQPLQSAIICLFYNAIVQIFFLWKKNLNSCVITSFKMSPSSSGGGKPTTTAGEHIFQLVETLFGIFFFLKKKNLNSCVIICL